MGKNITIVDIARECGLSIATVSRALNGDGKVKESTKERVMEAAKTLGYQENNLAKRLSDTTGNMIGMLVPDITTPFYGRIFAECEKRALQKGYVLTLCNSFNTLKLETHYYSHLLAQHACGIIQIGGSLDQMTIPQALYNQIRQTAEKIPVITSYPVPDTRCRCVYVDSEKSMRTLMEYLIGLGHRRIAFVGGRSGIRSTEDKRKTYLAILKQHGISREIICEGGYGQEFGNRAVKKLFREADPPTAIIAITDMCAIGVLKGLNEMHLQGGRDVSVVSFDNTYIAEMMEPELTSVSANYEMLGETIINTMVDMIEKRQTHDELDLPIDFSIRRSCFAVEKR